MLTQLPAVASLPLLKSAAGGASLKHPWTPLDKESLLKGKDQFS